MKKKYDMLYRELKEQILSGEYRAGEKLPSKRVMADRTGYSTVTVATAYGRLEDEGYILPRERSGYYVCRIETGGTRGGEVPAVPLIRLPEDTAEPMGELEYSLWFKTVRKVISEQGSRLFVKAPGKGCAVLRNAIAEYLGRYRGMHADPRRIIIGSGSEQLYETAIKVLGRELTVGIESPCYGQIPTVYEGMGVSVCRLRMGSDGIEEEALLSGGFDVLHVTPFHSYPSGVTTSIAKRYDYLSWAEKAGRYIIEDDFDSEFFMPGQPIEALYSLDSSDSVIYLNTFSKSLSPAMRIGYMILPEALLPIYEEKLGDFSCSVPVMEQYVLAEFIASGSFERHLNRMRRQMRAKP
ncbi:MAG: PLP-dependent aminotransferase family protein [Ruminococcaceae bacterium]|nr:PLP-dependent aminotransferase family protein [Oscillospiraceae bacterium]